MEFRKSVTEDPTTHALWTVEIDPYFGEINRPATRLETVVFKAKQFVHGLIHRDEV